MGEDNDQDPDDLVIAFSGFMGGAVHQHPDPEYKRGNRQRDNQQQEESQ